MCGSARCSSARDRKIAKSSGGKWIAADGTDGDGTFSDLPTINPKKMPVNLTPVKIRHNACRRIGKSRHREPEGLDRRRPRSPRTARRQSPRAGTPC